ncbi:hypothetical protein WHR41_04158 [Cladosporium halotolerans]|uniref:Uncharacterized protein n=1 Tax=Cladosporium halotolerans TaxID=1052096 RepID=A0AB34KQ41_9PEZI
MSSNDQSQNPSLVSGHAQYVKGAAESAIGAATGSPAWNDSAATDKQSGIDAMKAASQNRDANRDGYGKAEEVAGKMAGCEGMEREGKESKTE